MNMSYHHGDLRNSLIEAGIELINREGEKHFSLRKVAARCGVSQAAPYSHFKNKEDLLESMRDYVIRQFMEVLENAVESCPDQTDPKVLIRLGKSYVMFFIEHPQYYPFMFSQSFMEVNLSLDNEGTNDFPPFQLLKTVAVPILRESGMSRERIEDAIISLWATVHGLASIATMENVHYDKDWETKIEDIIWNK